MEGQVDDVPFYLVNGKPYSFGHTRELAKVGSQLRRDQQELTVELLAKRHAEGAEAVAESLRLEISALGEWLRDADLITHAHVEVDPAVPQKNEGLVRWDGQGYLLSSAETLLSEGRNLLRTHLGVLVDGISTSEWDALLVDLTETGLPRTQLGDVAARVLSDAGEHVRALETVRNYLDPERSQNAPVDPRTLTLDDISQYSKLCAHLTVAAGSKLDAAVADLVRSVNYPDFWIDFLSGVSPIPRDKELPELAAEEENRFLKFFAPSLRTSLDAVSTFMQLGDKRVLIQGVDRTAFDSEALWRVISSEHEAKPLSPRILFRFAEELMERGRTGETLELITAVSAVPWDTSTEPGGIDLSIAAMRQLRACSDLPSHHFPATRLRATLRLRQLIDMHPEREKWTVPQSELDIQKWAEIANYDSDMMSRIGQELENIPRRNSKPSPLDRAILSLDDESRLAFEQLAAEVNSSEGLLEKVARLPAFEAPHPGRPADDRTAHLLLALNELRTANAHGLALGLPQMTIGANSEHPASPASGSRCRAKPSADVPCEPDTRAGRDTTKPPRRDRTRTRDEL